ncbi:MAG: hypothetical protein FJ279_13775, partial [Planctomycetes bacterium]|nr:hypothetical protein [Planctomycetota bacterium]
MNPTPRLALALCLACLALSAATGSGQDQPLASHFGHAPQHALIRKLQAVESAGERRVRWMRELDALVIESHATPDGQAEAPVLELVFRLHEPYEDGGYKALAYRGNQQWYGSTFWTGPDWTRVGKDWHHPGENTPSVRRFTAPRDGRVTVSGRVYKLHKDGDGVRLMIRHNDRELWKAEIRGADDKGVEPNLTLDVKKGDALRFVVHKRGNIGCDTTYWDPVVAYADGASFQASKSFGPQQGAGGWFCEMLTDEAPPEVECTLHGLGPDLSLRDSPVTLKSFVVFSGRDGLPFVVVADAADQSGVVLAFNRASDWSCRASASKDGLLRVTLAASGKPPLSTVVLGAYDGAWTASFGLLKQLTDAKSPLPMDSLRDPVQAAYRSLTAPLARAPELALLLMAQTEWRRED